MSEKKCPSCGASIDANAAECKYCGESIIVEKNGYQQGNYQKNNSNYAYLKPYYQEQFQKIDYSNGTYKGKWNWCAFLFSWIWGLTKGLWGLSLATFIIDALFTGMKVGWIGLAISIVWGVMGNYFYYNLVKNNKQFPSNF